MEYRITQLPDGEALVTYPRARPGFTAPEAVLIGLYQSVEAARDAIAEAQAS